MACACRAAVLGGGESDGHVISNLGQLVAPMPVAAFRLLLRRRTPHLQRGGDPARAEGLASWATMLDALTSTGYPARKLNVTRGGKALPPVFFLDGDSVRRSAVEQALEAGGSAIAYDIEPFVPPLDALCRALSDETGERVSAGIIATTGEGGALDVHYDEEDIVVLQIEGSKRWLIYGDPEPDPVPRMKRVAREPVGEPILDAVVAPGDWLLVPAGYRHRCENCAGRSVHVGLMFFPLTPVRAIELLLRGMVQQVADRRPLRFDPADAAAVEAELHALLADRIGGVSLEELLARHRAKR